MTQRTSKGKNIEEGEGIPDGGNSLYPSARKKAR